MNRSIAKPKRRHQLLVAYGLHALLSLSLLALLIYLRSGDADGETVAMLFLALGPLIILVALMSLFSILAGFNGQLGGLLALAVTTLVAYAIEFHDLDTSNVSLVLAGQYVAATIFLPWVEQIRSRASRVSANLSGSQ